VHQPSNFSSHTTTNTHSRALHQRHHPPQVPRGPDLWREWQQWLPGWHRLTAAAKRERLSTAMCHELLFFLALRDPAFFSQVGGCVTVGAWGLLDGGAGAALKGQCRGSVIAKRQLPRLMCRHPRAHLPTDNQNSVRAPHAASPPARLALLHRRVAAAARECGQAALGLCGRGRRCRGGWGAGIRV